MDKEDVVHIYNGIILSHKRNEVTPFAATWMNLEIILSEVSQKEKNEYNVLLLICGIYNMTQMNISRLTDIKKRLVGLPWWRSG